MSNEVTTETRMLVCELSTEEQRLRGIELAAAETALLASDDAKKASAKRHKDGITTIQKHIYDLVKVVESGEEQRPVECTIEKLFDEGVVRVVRTDTGEVIDEFDVDADDLQMEMGG